MSHTMSHADIIQAIASRIADTVNTVPVVVNVYNYYHQTYAEVALIEPVLPNIEEIRRCITRNDVPCRYYLTRPRRILTEMSLSFLSSEFPQYAHVNSDRYIKHVRRAQGYVYAVYLHSVPLGIRVTTRPRNEFGNLCFSCEGIDTLIYNLLTRIVTTAFPTSSPT